MNTLTKALTPALLIAAHAGAMSVVHTPAWTETFEEPVYRSVPYSVEHVRHGLFHDTVTYTTEVRSVLDHYETKSETHPEAYTQIEDNGVATAIPPETFNAYLVGRTVGLRPGVRSTFRTNSRMSAGDPNDRVIDLGPRPVVVAAAPVVVAPAPVVVAPAPVVIAEPPPVVIIRRDPPPPAIVIGVGVHRHRRW